MYVETRDVEVFKGFWQDEKSNTPRFFNDASEVWTTTYNDFLAFCDRSWKVYLVGDNCLVYVEKDGKCANLHISFLRGTDAWGLMDDLVKLRNEILTEFELLYAWVGKHNRGLKKMVNALGMHHNGFCMYHGESHGKVLEWQNHSISRRELFTSRNAQSLLNF